MAAYERRQKRILDRLVAMLNEYDTIDAIIDLLAATVVTEVHDYLVDEYIAEYKAVTGFEPAKDSAEDVVQTVIDGKDYEDRIYQYFLEHDDPEGIATALEGLVKTESHRVRGAGSYEAGMEMMRAGYTVTKTWRSVKIPTTRDTHFDLDGTTVPIDDYFETVNGKTLYPGAFGIAEEDINCLCYLDIEVTEEADADE